MTRAVVAAIAVTVCVAYFSGGARGTGVSERDRLFSPADAAELQLRLPARDVPIDNLPTLSNLTGRFALFIALGRRSALRDLAAVATTLGIAAFAAWLIAIRIPLLIVSLTMLSMAASAMFWGRGIAWTFDALVPALIAIGLWLAARRRLPAAAIVLAVAALDSQWWVEPALGSSLAALISAFTPLGALLLVIGVIELVRDRATRQTAATAALILVAWQFIGPRSTSDPIGVPVAIGGWTGVAAGLLWIRRSLAARGGAALATVVALVVTAEPVLTRERFRVLGRDAASQARARIAAEVRPADLPDNAVFIAESQRADTMVLLAARLQQRHVVFIPQVPGRVRTASDQGMTLLSFANARANLEPFGFVFERETIGNTELNVLAGHAPCVDLKTTEPQDVSAVLASGSFIVHGSTPGSAPGGVVVEMPGSQLPRVSTIEPRSVPFEVNGTSIRVPASGRVEPVTITLTSVPSAATAVAEAGAPVRICPGVLREPLTLTRSATASASLRMSDEAPFGSGWHPIEADPDFFRWTAAPEALVRVSMAPPGPVRVTITATPAARASQQPAIGLIVNRCRLPLYSMQQGQGDYEWSVGSECWRSGINQVSIAVTPLISPATFFKTHDTRLLGARIGAIRLARDGR